MMEQVVRGAAIGVLALMAIQLWRAKGAYRLLGLGAASGCCYLLTASQDISDALGVMRLPLSMFATTGPLWILVSTRRLFGAPRVLRPGQLAVLGCGLAGLELGRSFLDGVGTLPSGALDLLLLGLFLATLHGAWTGLFDDLNPQRRSLRFVLLATSATFGALVAAAAAWDSISHRPIGDAVARDTGIAAAALLLSLAYGLVILKVRGAEPRQAAHVAAFPPATGAPVSELSVLARKIMTSLERDRAYRRAELSLSALARELGASERQVREAIHGELGHASFSAFVNGYRLREAASALIDPGQAETPISTIALDAGFGSIATFNRVFRAAYDASPTEFRARSNP